MMKVNIKLKNDFVKYIRSKKSFMISGMLPEKKDEIYKKIVSLLDKENYFVYREGSTKFNDKLMIVSKTDILNYLDRKYIIFDVETLDYMTAWIPEAYLPDGSDGECIEIDANGVFEKILILLSEEFEFNKIESKLPTAKY